MKQRKAYGVLAVLSAIATILEVIILGASGLSSLPAGRGPWAWLLVLLVGVSGFLWGYGYLGSRLWCSGNPEEPADSAAVGLAEEVIHSGEWCKVPKVTDLGGMAIALTAIRQLTWRVELMKREIDRYLTEWAREGVRDLGAQRVTAMLHTIASRNLIKMQLECDSHLEGLIEKQPQLKRFREQIQGIIDAFSRRVVGPLMHARGEADGANAQTYAADEVRTLLKRVQTLEDDIGKWKDLIYTTSRDLRAKLLGRALGQGAA